jgi:ASC-1-like (ASCH) protein
MRVKRITYNTIKSGRKTIEVRVGRGSTNGLQAGERVRLITYSRSFNVRVVGIRRYSTFAEMLDFEPWEKIALSSESKDRMLSLLRQIYPPHKERLGVVAIEFARVYQQ